MANLVRLELKGKIGKYVEENQDFTVPDDTG